MSCQQRLLCKCARFQIERDLHKNCSVMHQHSSSSSSSGPRLAAAALLLQSFGSLVLNICKYKYANTQIHMLQQSKASKAAAAAKPNTCFFCCNPLDPWYCKFANTNTAIDKYRCTQIHKYTCSSSPRLASRLAAAPTSAAAIRWQFCKYKYSYKYFANKNTTTNTLQIICKKYPSGLLHI